MNELLWFGFAILNFLLFLAIYKLFGKIGIIAWIAIGTILANIQVTKSITVFGLHATMGNIMYGTVSLATDALNELYDKRVATKAVLLGFFALCATLIIMQVALLFQPNAEDISQDSLKTIFGFFPRIVLGSLTAYIVSQCFDIYLFQKIREKLPADKHLWIRNKGSTFVSQLVDTIIFVLIAFLGVYSFPVVFQIILSTYLVKAIVAVMDTPFLYLIKRIKPLE